MGRLFDNDTPFMQKLQYASSVFFCGIFFLLTCLPVITAGAGATAMYRMMFNLREDKGTKAADFFRVFAEEFKKSTILWALDIAGALLILVLLYGIGLLNPEGAGLAVCMAVFLVAVLLWAFTFCYVFPLEARFENTIGNIVKNGLIMSIRHRKQTIPALFLAMIPLFIYILSPYVFILLGPVWVFVLIPAIFYWQSGLFLKVFENYMPAEDAETADNE